MRTLHILAIITLLSAAAVNAECAVFAVEAGPSYDIMGFENADYNAFTLPTICVAFLGNRPGFSAMGKMQASFRDFGLPARPGYSLNDRSVLKGSAGVQYTFEPLIEDLMLFATAGFRYTIYTVKYTNDLYNASDYMQPVKYNRFKRFSVPLSAGIIWQPVEILAFVLEVEIDAIPVYGFYENTYGQQKTYNEYGVGIFPGIGVHF